jgi:hypothetical protein
MKMTVFGVVAPCSLVEVYRRLLAPSSGRSLIALMMEAASTSEMSVNFYQTTRRNNPEDKSFSLLSFLSSNISILTTHIHVISDILGWR